MTFFELPQATLLLTIYHTGFKKWTYVKPCILGEIRTNTQGELCYD